MHIHAYIMHIHAYTCIYYAYTMHIHAYAVQIYIILYIVRCIPFFFRENSDVTGTKKGMSILPHQKVQSHSSVAFAHQLDLGEDHGSKVLSSPAQRSYPRAWRSTDRGHQCRWLVNPGGICFKKMT